MVNSKKVIYTMPFYEIAKEIEDTKQDIFLVGPKGSGKTTTLQVLKNNPYQLIFGGVESEEYLVIPDKKIFDLYYIVLLTKKILDYFTLNNATISKDPNFIMFGHKINEILIKIRIMYIKGKYSQSFCSELLNNPQLLLTELNKILSKYPEVNANYLLAIDDFDKVGYSSSHYQQIIYTSLKDSLRCILTVSDPDVVNNPEVLNSKGKVVSVNYSQDLNYIRQILSINFQGRLDPTIITDNILRMLIDYSKGNIILMFGALNSLISHSHELTSDEYGDFLANYFHDRLDMNKTGIVERNRKLYI